MKKMIAIIMICFSCLLRSMQEREPVLQLAPIATFRQRLTAHKFNHIVRKTHIDQVLSDCQKTPSQVVNTVEAFVGFYNTCVQDPNLKEGRVSLLIEIVLLDYPDIVEQLKKD